jgi:hypothetical protein
MASIYPVELRFPIFKYKEHSLEFAGVIYLAIRKNRRSSGASRVKRPYAKESRKKMLNLHRVTPFRYDMREIVAETQLDDSTGPALIASVIAKASRVSTKDAKDYVREFETKGEITRRDADDICRLLDRYSKYR